MIEDITLTDAERSRVIELLEEGRVKAQTFRQMFTNDTKGMMLFHIALCFILKTWPSVAARVDRTQALTTEWVIAGEPEDPAAVPDKVMERHRRVQG